MDPFSCSNRTQQEALLGRVLVASIQALLSNPRINDQAVEHVTASIRRFGWRQPIVARTGGVVIANNTRLEAARLLGRERVPVVWFEGTDVEAKAFGTADNKTHDYGTRDEPLLAKLLEELRAEVSIEWTGFSDQEIDSSIAELEAQARAGRARRSRARRPTSTSRKEMYSRETAIGQTSERLTLLRLEGALASCAATTAPLDKPTRDLDWRL